MCTSLLYLDTENRPYVGRTLELSIALPYLVARFPRHMAWSSQAEGHAAIDFTTQYALLGVVMPYESLPTDHMQPQQLTLIEAVNEKGLSYSVQSYNDAGGPQPYLEPTKDTLSVVDLGMYLLGTCASISEVKTALTQVQVALKKLPMLGGLEMPFHYALRDSTGATLVIEFHQGELSVYDNPVGVMTNGPAFNWHLTNVNNYTYLSNIDHYTNQFMQYVAQQPGTGNAKAGLPASDTSVDRFIRAVYYANFAEKQSDADQAVHMVAHIMNNFDRPRGITRDAADAHQAHLSVQGVPTSQLPTEYTSWTSITDLTRQRLYLRDSSAMNYVCLDLAAQADHNQFKLIPLQELLQPVPDVSQQLA